jgi:hypothetical protein
VRPLIALIALAALAACAVGQCWGPALRLPVRQAPTPAIAPLAPPADGSWARHPAGYWWRYRPAAPAKGKAAPKAKKAGCGCNGPACDCGPAACPCKRGGKPCSGGCDCLVAAPPPRAKWQTSGVDKDKIDGEPRILRRGREISRAQAMSLVEGKELPDDAAKQRLTVIGPEADRRKVLDDLERAPELAPFKGKLAVQSYDPANWAVERSGFVTGGKPTIYVQAPSGKVLHRQDDYEGGAPALAEAIRKADPSYDPAKDPDLRKPAPAPDPDQTNPLKRALGKWPSPAEVPWYAWVLAGAGVLLLLKRK